MLTCWVISGVNAVTIIWFGLAGFTVILGSESKFVSPLRDFGIILTRRICIVLPIICLNAKATFEFVVTPILHDSRVYPLPSTHLLPFLIADFFVFCLHRTQANVKAHTPFCFALYLGIGPNSRSPPFGNKIRKSEGGIPFSTVSILTCTSFHSTPSSILGTSSVNSERSVEITLPETISFALLSRSSSSSSSCLSRSSIVLCCT